MMRNFSAKEAEFDERIVRIARATDAFEAYRNPHAERIAQLSDALAQQFNLASHDRYSLRQAALLHDVGAAQMNREYIRAARGLREDERVDMQRHTVIGEQETAKKGLSRAVQLLVRWHHEWWNGAGYPDALERGQIPLAARILRLADTFCAMTDDRPYRAAVSETDAKKYLTEWAGIEFDPMIVRAFLNISPFSAVSRPSVPVDEGSTFTKTNGNEPRITGDEPQPPAVITTLDVEPLTTDDKRQTSPTDFYAE